MSSTEVLVAVGTGAQREVVTGGEGRDRPVERRPRARRPGSRGERTTARVVGPVRPAVGESGIEKPGAAVGVDVRLDEAAFRVRRQRRSGVDPEGRRHRVGLLERVVEIAVILVREHEDVALQRARIRAGDSRRAAHRREIDDAACWSRRFEREVEVKPLEGRDLPVVVTGLEVARELHRSPVSPELDVVDLPGEAEIAALVLIRCERIGGEAEAHVKRPRLIPLPSNEGNICLLKAGRRRPWSVGIPAVVDAVRVASAFTWFQNRPSVETSTHAVSTPASQA